MREAWKKSLSDKWSLHRYDKNKDGKLDKTETAARDKAHAERKKRHDEFIKKYDTSKDGKLDRDEWKKAIEARRAERAEGQSRVSERVSKED